MAQTAVEWLIEQYIDKSMITPSMIEQAKEMDKDRLFHAFYGGGGIDYSKDVYKQFKQYYNETYKPE